MNYIKIAIFVWGFLLFVFAANSTIKQVKRKSAEWEKIAMFVWFYFVCLFFSANSAIKQVKRKSAEWEKIASHISDKELISGIHKEFLQLKNK